MLLSPGLRTLVLVGEPAGLLANPKQICYCRVWYRRCACVSEMHHSPGRDAQTGWRPAAAQPKPEMAAEPAHVSPASECGSYRQTSHFGEMIPYYLSSYVLMSQNQLPMNKKPTSRSTNGRPHGRLGPDRVEQAPPEDPPAHSHAERN